MNYQYTIITKDTSNRVINFDNWPGEMTLLQHVGDLAGNTKMEIKRIVRMDEFGHTDEMEVVFEDGRLKLKAVPKVVSGR
ncbi:hypothetical protein [Paenibacillus alkalitolerans]|uniref:hypothetical protein n=1 Tax=Paenibacillus alkalitolerans TaxID=2799335 RepID=UPI0018F35E2E|nr:hypothetical protein [Paenibacillus alkalitolerans]